MYSDRVKEAIGGAFSALVSANQEGSMEPLVSACVGQHIHLRINGRKAGSGSMILDKELGYRIELPNYIYIYFHWLSVRKITVKPGSTTLHLIAKRE